MVPAYIHTRKKLGLGFEYVTHTQNPFFSYPRNPSNLSFMGMGLGMKPTKSEFHGYGSGYETHQIRVLGMGMRLIPKTRTQFFSGVNV